MSKSRMIQFAGMILTVLFILSGCGAGGVKKAEIPDWYLNPPKSNDKIYGVGASEKSESIQLGKSVADANARAALASTIQVSVQTMVRTFLQQSGNMEASRTLQFSEAVGKQVVDVSLTGATISKTEVKDGRFFSLAEISMDSVKGALLSAVKDAAAQYSEQKARQAFDDLGKEIEKKNIPIVEK